MCSSFPPYRSLPYRAGRFAARLARQLLTLQYVERTMTLPTRRDTFTERVPAGTGCVEAPAPIRPAAAASVGATGADYRTGRSTAVRRHRSQREPASMRWFGIHLVLAVSLCQVAFARPAARAGGAPVPLRLASVWQNPHGNSFRVRVAGNYAYLTNDETSHSLEIVDISNPAHPLLLSHGPSLAHGGYITGLAVSGNEVYIGHAGYVTVIDATNPRAPRVVGDWFSGAAPNRLFLQIAGKRLYVGVGGKGLFVLDLSDAAHPREA